MTLFLDPQTACVHPTIKPWLRYWRNPQKRQNVTGWRTEVAQTSWTGRAGRGLVSFPSEDWPT